ncbi:MAG: DotG/IcmE/VirB10 family protein [Roseibium sp.]|uniref:DotG/IcmE/VirB10 family protein n=1 Tax=Roseibium sp. TaxID=1936156 RepID=UPI00329739FD
MTTENDPIEEGFVDVPEAEDIDEAQGPERNKKTMSTMAKLLLISGGLLVLVVGGIIWSVNKEVTANRLANTPVLDTTPGGINAQTNDRYRGYVAETNDRGADLAANQGDTFIPVPESFLKEDEDLVGGTAVEVEAEEPAPPPAVERVVKTPPPPPPAIERTPVPAPPQRQQAAAPAQQQAAGGQQEEKENPYTNAMSLQMGSIARSYEAKVSQKFDGPDVVTARDVQAAEDAAAAVAAENDGSVDDDQGFVLRPGDILYGETLTSVSSDASSPVLVELTTGEFKGARLVGTFTTPKGADSLVVSFSRMTLTDGTTLSINGFAVDGKSAETAVASDVERRYVKRYLPVFASTFIAGFASAASQPATTISDNGNGQTVSTEQSTTEEAALSGLAAASGVIASDIMKNAPSGPKISLRDGYPIAIMIMDPVTVDAPIEETFSLQPNARPQLGIPGPSRAVSVEN